MNVKKSLAEKKLFYQIQHLECPTFLAAKNSLEHKEFFLQNAC
jgi:hypothetical protein